MAKFQYDNGLPFDSTLAKNILSLKDRIGINKASLLIIDGGVGEGKTTLGVHTGDFYQGSEINLKEQYAIGGDMFQEKLQICYEKKLPVVIYDEAGDFDRRGALTDFNKRLNRVFQTFRAFQVLVILILPNFNILDQSLFDLKVPRLLLNCRNRSTKQGDYAGYSLYRMQYIRYKMQKLPIKEYAYSQVTPNFRGHFLDLPHARAKELEKISIEGKLNIVSENILAARGLVSIKQISSKVHRSHIWVRGKLKKLKIKENLTHKRLKYYDSSAIDLLIGELGG